MAIPITTIQKRRVAKQIEDNLTGLQRDMRNNALTHKAMAAAQSPELAKLQAYVADSAQSYLRRLQWIIDLRGNAGRRQQLVDILATTGVAEQELVDPVTALRSVAVALRDADKSDHAAITTACDAVLAAVDAPMSLWP